MCSLNKVNEEWACENEQVLTVDLKGRMNFSGWVMSDWGATHKTSALMAGLARTAKARDCARLEWAVLDWNELALDFYRGLGATGMKRWTTWRLDGERLEALAE